MLDKTRNPNFLSDFKSEATAVPPSAHDYDDDLQGPFIEVKKRSKKTQKNMLKNVKKANMNDPENVSSIRPCRYKPRPELLSQSGSTSTHHYPTAIAIPHRSCPFGNFSDVSVEPWFWPKMRYHHFNRSATNT